jgi:hypothetical protein
VAKQESTKDVAVTAPTDDMYRDIKSLQDALTLARETYGEPQDVSEVLGNGFNVLPTADKGRLVGVPFLIMEWRFYQGDQGEAVALMLVTEQGEKLIVNDGSTGIREQLKSLPRKPVIVRRGLVCSDYDYTNPATGEVSRATTYYLSTSK